MAPPNDKHASDSHRPPLGAARVALPDGGADDVVLEAPLVLDSGAGQIVTMRTPMGEQADLDWAIGFLASEGVIQSVRDVLSIEWVGSDPAVDPMPPISDTVVVKLAPGIATGASSILKRGHEMRASCGICGVQSPAALVRSIGKVERGGRAVDAARVASMLGAMRAKQILFQSTGGCHGAALFDRDGGMIALAEDIGRHNALDRVIGAALRRGLEPRGMVLALSGRAGYELVVKALRVGIPTIVSVGAASAFAVELARAAGATLIGFARDDGRIRVYADGA